MARLTTNPNRLVVGMTGGIGAGKSTVEDEFVRLGVQVVDADCISRLVMTRGQAAYEQIAEQWPQFIDEDGNIDRKKLRNHVMKAKPADRAELNAITHPEIGKEIDRQLALRDLGYYAVLDSPLLLETGGEARVDRVLVVDVPVDIQRQRALERDPGGNIDEIIKIQIPRGERRERADDIVKNDKDKMHLRRQICALHFSTHPPLALAKPPPRR